ncbi:hypothetical protein DFH08DRAFT_804642 [Mycena albidolilacea]|uniref:Uncharacterized protein n=1 Tax=Mycena albidolilacea TaxID=1033008 RepID=A0AAD7A9X1_9AGAR|nr:hypothetical protein DFH08DRAFT_804642 [Mycena albidolilacea]
MQTKKVQHEEDKERNGKRGAHPNNFLLTPDTADTASPKAAHCTPPNDSRHCVQHRLGASATQLAWHLGIGVGDVTPASAPPIASTDRTSATPVHFYTRDKSERWSKEKEKKRHGSVVQRRRKKKRDKGRSAATNPGENPPPACGREARA